MSQNTDQTTSFFGRVVSNDIFKRGVAGAVGSLITTVLIEAIFKPES